MPRPKVPRVVQDQVLSECRRRCALCYALNNDVSAKVHGQLAHMDRNPANNKAENLAYLCLEHAGLYDVRSSQSKGFTPGELSAYKTKLLLVLDFVHDPRHIRRIVSQEYRKLAAEAAAKNLAGQERAQSTKKRGKTI